MNQREVTIHKRIEIWMEELKNHLYEPVEEIQFSAFFTMDMLSYEEAVSQKFHPIYPGDKWGRKWEYGWFKSTITLPKSVSGKSIYFMPNIGGEMLVYLDGDIVGAVDLQHDGIFITHDGKQGDTYEILMESYAGHGPRLEHGGPMPYGQIAVPEPPEYQVTVKSSTYGIWNKELFDLYMDAYTLYQLYNSLEDKSLRKKKIKEGLMEFTKVIDFEAPIGAQFPYQRVKEILTPLLACKNGSTAPEFTIFGQSHLDLAWKWPWEETRRKCARTLSTQLTLMEEYKEYKFFLCEPVISESLKKDYPKLYEKVKDKVRKGQIIPEGGMWVEADTNIPSGESLIRQCTFGKKWFTEELDVDTKLVWLPDCFGFSGQLPQIMIGCGMKYFATQKLARALKGHDKFPYNNFYWEGIDGTSILTHFYKKNNSRYDPFQLNERWNEDRVQEENIDTFLFPFGFGDGGGGATRDMLEGVLRTKDLEGAPRTKMESPIEFFKDLEKRGQVFNRYVGEIYLPWHRGTYTAEARIKKGNRRAEFALRDFEIFLTLKEQLLNYKSSSDNHVDRNETNRYGANIIASKSDFMSRNEITNDELDSINLKKQLRELWEKLLFNHFHDIIAGTSIRRVHEESYADLLDIEKKANELKELLLADASNKKKDSSKANSIMVFNSLSWERNELIQLPEGFNSPCDYKGNLLPVCEANGKIYCKLGLPSLGVTTIYQSKKETIKEPEKKIFADNNSLENEIIRINVNEFGHITSIYDKEKQVEFAASNCNRIRMYQDINIEYDAWELSPYYNELEVELDRPATIKVLHCNSLFATLFITREINDSYLEQEITIYAHSRRIDFKTRINWKETHKLLKVDFPVNVHSQEAIEEIQFGYVKRPTHKSKNSDADRFEVCNHKYTVLTESTRSFAVLNDSKYGVSTTNNSIELTLLRSPVIPDMYSDKGEHEFTYSILANNCDFINSDIVQEAYNLNTPVTVLEGDLGHMSLFTLSDNNVILETVKPAEDGSKDMILRLYESKNGHRNCNLFLGFDIDKAYEVSMLEHIDENAIAKSVVYDKDNKESMVSLDFRPFEIKTLRIIMK